MTPLPSLQQLRFLSALAEHKHFGHAAAACAVTQSTLSAGLQELEERLRGGGRGGGARPPRPPHLPRPRLSVLKKKKERGRVACDTDAAHKVIDVLTKHAR